MSSLVSVIVPVYNVEKYLANCLDSILAQSYSNLEIILINDGSTDSSPDICRDYEAKDKRVVLYSKENGGLSSARNLGIEYAQGELIAFVDSDDSISVDYIEYLASLLEREGADMATCLYALIYGDNTIPGATKEADSTSEIVVSGLQGLGYALYAKSTSLHAPCKLYRKSLFQNTRFPEGKLYEDAGTTYKVMTAATTIVISTARKYYYFRRSDSITGRGYIPGAMDLVKFSQDILDSVRDKDPSIVAAAEYNLFSSSITVLQAILSSDAAGQSNARKDTDILLDIARKYARSTAANNQASLQRRVFALSALLGKSTLLAIMKAKLYILKVKMYTRKKGK